MPSRAIAACAYYLSIFCTLALLVAELAVFRPRMDRNAVRLLPQLDLGRDRGDRDRALAPSFFAKGVAFAAAGAMFWIKMALFLPSPG